MTSERHPPLKVAWISDFPLEWLPDLPDALKTLPRQYGMTWQRVLLDEFEKRTDLRLHILILRKHVKADVVFERNGVTFHVLKIPAGIRAPTIFWADSWRLKPAIRQIAPDVVHAWGTERGAAIVAHRIGFPYVVTIQGLLSWYAEIIPINIHHRFATWLEKRSLPHAPLVTTESTFAVKYLQRRFKGLAVHQAEHAPNWSFHQIARKPQLDPVRFIFVGKAGYRKGFDLVLTALERLKNKSNFELVLVGEYEPGFFEQHQARYSKDLWARVTLKQNLTAQEVAAELGRATMMLFPTRADTSPNAVKEAVVAGVPVIGSDVGGIPDYVFSDLNGFLFPSGDLEAFSRVIEKALDHPHFRSGRVDTATLAKTREYLSPKRMAERFMEAYRLVNKQNVEK